MTKHCLFYTLTAGLIALPLCFSIAQDGKGKGRPDGGGKGGPQGRPGFEPPSFADLDADSSGDVSKEEWIAFQVKMARERAERSFGFIAGDDGKITEGEIKTALERRGNFGRPGGGMKGGPERGGDKGAKGKGKGGDGSGEGTKPKRPEIEE
ncbi:MAG: hypothetical protein P1U89_24495 [Verrucomicrobiales bacterium]|nr:hypothetical protein [Verrucomicrobiales bacterium]